MFLAKNWVDYAVLDSSSGEKLERWGKYILRRPDPQVIWQNPKKNPLWKKCNGHYHRSKAGGGDWEFFDLPKQWKISYGLNGKPEQSLTFHLKPFAFKHTGLFPEQAANWDWFSEKIAEEKKRRLEKGDKTPIKVLNLFAYTGGATLAAAKAGAELTHVDASKGMVQWAKENAELSGLASAPIRYLVDDYGIKYYAAFVGCSAETEASFETVSFLAKKMDELGLKHVMTIEGPDKKIAATVIENTKDKNQDVLALNSMQSVTTKDIEGGETYLGVMQQNLEVLKKALQ